MKNILGLIFLVLWVNMLYSQDVTALIAPDNTEVLIVRDEYGVPHINASSEVALFYAQGYATAEDRLSQMYINLYAAEGRVSEVLGEDFNDFDVQTRNIYYSKEERTAAFNQLEEPIRLAIEAYAQGVNEYVELVYSEPETYMPMEVALLRLYGITLDEWTPESSIAVIQFYVRNFGAWGGEELDRLAELDEMGWETFNADRPINDPSAPTTIPPDSRTAYKHTEYKEYTPIEIDPKAVEEAIANRQIYEELRKRLGIPDHFGSFGAVVSPEKSASGNAMLLGCPQMGAPKLDSTNVVYEIELKSPSFHVGGMTVAGVPFVIIGRTQTFAWTLTSGATDNQDVYIDSVSFVDNKLSQYYFNGDWVDFETRTEIIPVFGEPTEFTFYRSVHGPVFGFDMENSKVFTMKMSFWNKELDMLQSWYDMAKSNSLEEFEETLKKVPVSFNVMYANIEGTIKYWHVGYYNNRLDGVDPRLPHKGDGSEEWDGIIPFEELPQMANPSQQFFVNWNNKPAIWWDNGDNVPYGSNHPLSDSITNRVMLMDDFVRPTTPFTFQNLKDIPHEIQDHGTYQQALVLDPNGITGVNIVPPGQSGFVDVSGMPSPHKTDQWELHLNWDYKPQIFDNPIYLPVELEAFDAEIEKSNVILTWVTATETNNRGFEVERSADGIDFQKIAFIDGKGTTEKKSVYLYKDIFNPGERFYRLKQIDYDGSIHYSEIIDLSKHVVKEFALYQNYPNPFNPVTSIAFSLPEPGTIRLLVYDATGEQVASLINKYLESGFHSVEFEVDQLSSGVYYYSIIAEGKVLTKKMILMK